MPELIVTKNHIHSMSVSAINVVREIEEVGMSLPQIPSDTQHVIHGGMYARTVMVPAGAVLTGALIKKATILIVSGDAVVYVDGKPVHISGHNVFAASANRKQIFVAEKDTYLTMIFPTDVKTVYEAEEQFTDEADKLFSRHIRNRNFVTITGE